MAALIITDIGKQFVMHLRGGIRIPVISALSFAVESGECVVLNGPSGAGKSSVLKMIYGTYGVESGQILIEHLGGSVDIALADPRLMKQVRRKTIGYVSQFLRVVPRVSAIDLVAEPLISEGVEAETATNRAETLLERLNVPSALWALPPATFSGGEQQRINIARSFITDHPVLLLDEPSASLDAKNRQVVIDLIGEKKRAGVAMLGIFHDPDVRDAVADRLVNVSSLASVQADHQKAVA
ncbi:phosphonate C-P lyase system protein PhnL [Rhizobium miluonense]|uniref:Alpha-D-ribose 1-methylphosphonate 5-triphosphate synthase subunit PhnL n=1 Tax=Rhizobium miluonense TaxID=411945 RepID=A0A1C3WDU0_9HYPH|nr:phosphonate C-P lyase system protein PhnL [Rhizobium miluonense]SCB38219.1 alpha-D-ribose 1-methylphosphonate 5-triphosphate synthase subunit PhnL [Rhizobium miluonense]